MAAPGIRNTAERAQSTAALYNMSQQIQLRRGTAEAAVTSNPVLAVGEIGIESNTGRFKIGDGSSQWNDLPYSTGSLPIGGTVGQVLAKINSADFNTHWITPASGGGGTSNGIPQGGDEGQVLTKNTSDDFDADWNDPPSGLPVVTQINQVLSTDGNGDVVWATPTVPPRQPTAPTSASNVVTIDTAASDIAILNLTENITTVNFTNVEEGRIFILETWNTTDNWTVTWPVNIKWAGGVMPVQSTGHKIDIYTFVMHGGIIFGSAVLGFIY